MDSHFYSNYVEPFLQHLFYNETNHMDLYAWSKRTLYPDGDMSYSMSERPEFGWAHKNRSKGGAKNVIMVCLGVFVCSVPGCLYQKFHAGVKDLIREFMISHAKIYVWSTEPHSHTSAAIADGTSEIKPKQMVLLFGKLFTLDHTTILHHSHQEPQRRAKRNCVISSRFLQM